MSTQRQRAVNALVAAAAREAESATRHDTTGQLAFEPLAKSIATSLDASDTTGSRVAAAQAASGMEVNDGLQALIDGSAIALRSISAPSAPDRFTGQPPAVQPAVLRHTIGASRFRPKFGK